MGIGQTLKEGFPAAISEGPGAGGWNVHLYHLPLARDCAIGQAQFNIMPAHDKEDPKGMSEVVLNPILAAITNAVADATGKRFRDLPLKSEMIKASIS
jgi:CO/xanthine dehydrogenase Mo-binding subunit